MNLVNFALFLIILNVVNVKGQLLPVKNITRACLDKSEKTNTASIFAQYNTLLKCVRSYCGLENSNSGYTECGRSYMTSLCGRLTSPPKVIIELLRMADRSKEQNCEWFIEVPNWLNVKLIFEAIDISYSGPNCWNNYVAVYDGAIGATSEIGRFCGKPLPVLRYVYSSTHQMTVKLHLEETTIANRQIFKASYVAVKRAKWMRRELKHHNYLRSKQGRVWTNTSTINDATDNHYFHRFKIQTFVGLLLNVSWTLSFSHFSKSQLTIYDGPNAFAEGKLTDFNTRLSREMCTNSTIKKCSGGGISSTFSLFVFIKQDKTDEVFYFTLEFFSKVSGSIQTIDFVEKQQYIFQIKTSAISRSFTNVYHINCTYPYGEIMFRTRTRPLRYRPYYLYDFQKGVPRVSYYLDTCDSLGIAVVNESLINGFRYHSICNSISISYFRASCESLYLVTYATSQLQFGSAEIYFDLEYVTYNDIMSGRYQALSRADYFGLYSSELRHKTLGIQYNIIPGEKFQYLNKVKGHWSCHLQNDNIIRADITIPADLPTDIPYVRLAVMPQIFLDINIFFINVTMATTRTTIPLVYRIFQLLGNDQCTSLFEIRDGRKVNLNIKDINSFYSVYTKNFQSSMRQDVSKRNWLYLNTQIQFNKCWRPNFVFIDIYPFHESKTFCKRKYNSLVLIRTKEQWDQVPYGNYLAHCDTDVQHFNNVELVIGLRWMFHSDWYYSVVADGHECISGNITFKELVRMSENEKLTEITSISRMSWPVNILSISSYMLRLAIVYKKLNCRLNGPRFLYYRVVMNEPRYLDRSPNCPENYIFMDSNCYKLGVFNGTGKNEHWNAANKICLKDGGHLVTLESEDKVINIMQHLLSTAWKQQLFFQHIHMLYIGLVRRQVSNRDPNVR